MGAPRTTPPAIVGDDQADILLWIGMKGLADATELHERWRAEKVKELVTEDLLQVDGDFALLTPAGEAFLTARLHDRAGGNIAELELFLSQFEEMDAQFKALATEWQRLRSNADDDPDALMRVVERWTELDQRVQRAVVDSPPASALLAAFLPSLTNARHSFNEGDWDSFTGVGEGSYHSLWFAIHEVLLRALGRQRTT